MEELVSIITINYNGWHDTCTMISSFKNYENYPYELIVVDNASKGEDVERIREKFPDIKVICSEQNLGFAGGNNLGYRYAVGKYIFFINNDTVIKAPMLEALVKRLKDPVVGGVSPMISNYYFPHEVQYYGYQKLSSITLRHTTPAYDAHHPEKYLYAREVDVMHGAAMMVPRSIIDQVGTMVECYFLYYEEFDWSYQIRNKGYQIWYEPASLVFHKDGTKSGMLVTPLREYYLVRGRIFFARRNLSGMKRFLSCLYLTAQVVPRNVLRYLFCGRWISARSVILGAFHGIFKDLG